MLPHGHSGQEFRSYCDLSYGLFQVFHNDSESEVYDAYELHGLMHFLRMLSYIERDWPATHPVVVALSDKRDVTIVDYGCGLAQYTRGLAETLQERDQRPRGARRHSHDEKRIPPLVGSQDVDPYGIPRVYER